MPVLQNYDDGNKLEEVFKTVVTVTPWEIPFFSGLGKRKIYSTIDQWPQASLLTASFNANIEGATHTFGTVTAPTRITNLTQIFKKTYLVSSTEIALRGAGVDDMYLYQKMQAMRELGTDIELSLLHGSLASGTGSAARRLAGAVNFITTNATGVASGTKLTESFFNGQCQGCWTQGGMPNEVYVPGQLKRVITSYTASSTLYTDRTDKRVINSTSVYENDFTLMRVIPSRIVNGTTNSNATCLIVTTNMWKVGVLEPLGDIPAEQIVGNIDGKAGGLRGEITLEAKAQQHSAVVTGLDTSFVV